MGCRKIPLSALKVGMFLTGIDRYDTAGWPCVPPSPVDLAAESPGQRTIREIRDAVREGLNVEDILRQVAA